MLVEWGLVERGHQAVLELLTDGAPVTADGGWPRARPFTYLRKAAQPLCDPRCLLTNEQPDSGLAGEREPHPDSTDRLCGTSGAPKEGWSEFEVRVRLALREGAEKSREIRDTMIT